MGLTGVPRCDSRVPCAGKFVCTRHCYEQLLTAFGEYIGIPSSREIEMLEWCSRWDTDTVEFFLSLIEQRRNKMLRATEAAVGR